MRLTRLKSPEERATHRFAAPLWVLSLVFVGLRVTKEGTEVENAAAERIDFGAEKKGMEEVDGAEGAEDQSSGRRLKRDRKAIISLVDCARWLGEVKEGSGKEMGDRRIVSD